MLPAEYDVLYKPFDPTDFNTREWIKIAKAAGARYIVFTAKHHDGFCMFYSRLTDYDITATPFKRDIVAELGDACHQGGMGFGIYYSLPDWHHPDFRTERHGKYVEYLHGQIRELCTHYGSVDILWFEGKRQGTAQTWDAARLCRLIREAQPHILINDRVYGDTDFDTPEQVIGRFSIDQPWESCITLGQQCACKPDDDIKTAAECIRLLVRCAGGGNLLLNVGPMPTGAIEPRQVKRLREIGAWLEHYGESIYGTRGGHLEPSYWGASTRRGKTVYVHILKGWESSVELPPIERRIVSSRLMGGGDVTVTQTPEAITIAVPESSRRPPVSIVALTLDGPAVSITPKWANIGMLEGATAEGSNVRRNELNYAPVMAVDQSPLSRWANDDGVTQAWLEIHLPRAVTFDVMLIDEAFGSRIQGFELRAKEGAQWKTFHTGKTVGRNWAAKFEPVNAQDLRIEILRATDAPTLRDVQLHFVDRRP